MALIHWLIDTMNATLELKGVRIHDIDLQPDDLWAGKPWDWFYLKHK